MTPSDILVVHADAAVAGEIRATLEADGLRVRVAADGLEALDAVDQAVPSLILLDTMLPRLDGVTLMQSLMGRPDTRSTPVIILSGRVDPSAILQGFAAGARYYLAVPFLPSDLRAKVRRLLSSSNA